MRDRLCLTTFVAYINAIALMETLSASSSTNIRSIEAKVDSQRILGSWTSLESNRASLTCTNVACYHKALTTTLPSLTDVTAICSSHRPLHQSIIARASSKMATSGSASRGSLMQLYLHNADTLVDHLALGLPCPEFQRLKLAGLTSKLDRLSTVIGRGTVPVGHPNTVVRMQDPLLGMSMILVAVMCLQLY